MLKAKPIPAILFVCLLLFAWSVQSSAKHLFDGGFIKQNIKQEIKQDINKKPNDHQGSPGTDSKTDSRTGAKTDPTKWLKQSYDFHPHWREGSTTNESDTLQFFYDHHVTIELNQELDFEYDGFEISYFYWIYNAQDKTGHLHTVEYTDDREKSFNVQFDKWEQMQFKVKSREPSKRFELKLTFSKEYADPAETGFELVRDELFDSYEFDSMEVGSDEVGNDKGDLVDHDKELILTEKRLTIYINSLSVKFSATSGEKRTVRFDVLDGNRFTAQVDLEQVSREQLFNYLLMPKLTDHVTSYHLTFMDSAPFNWTLNNEYPEYSGDICLEFAYQATRNSILRLKVLNKQETSFFALLTMDGTEIRFQDDTPKSPVFQRTKWSVINVCLRDLFPNCNQLRDFYRLGFESALPSGTSRKEFVAIGNIRINKRDYAEKSVKSYLTNWKTNGSAAATEWFDFFEDTQLTVATEHNGKRETTNLQFWMEGQPYTSANKSVCLLSEWFEIEESEEMRFQIDSQLDGARYRIMLLDFQMVALYSTDIIAIEPNVTTPVTFKFFATIVSLFKNKPGRVKLVITYVPKKANLNRSLTVHSLHLSDPCHDENLCHKRGECQTPTSNSYQCVCEKEYSGDNCEFENKCILEDEQGISGVRYCLTHNGTDCVPANNDFMCKCRTNFQWNNFTKNCEYISSCLLKFCGLHEVCYESQGREPVCRCKASYTRDEKTNRCVFDLCKALPEHMQCKANEKCVSVVGEKERRCICPLENRKKDGECLAEKLIDNPLIKQHHGCAHTYKYGANGAVVCSCFPGYQLDEDRKSCLGDLTAKCTPGCGFRGICVLNEKSNQHECRCQMGFSGPDCKMTYCSTADKEEIFHICGHDVCVEQKYESDNFKTGFSCNCDKRVAVENEKTGLCDVKPVCTEEKVKKCQEKNAICVPKLDIDDHFLKYRCLCRKGYLEDYSDGNKCKEICSVKSPFFPNKEANKELCVIDWLLNQRFFDCTAGFLANSETGTCDAGQNLLKINFDFKMRNLDTIENEINTPQIEYAAEYYCGNLSTKLTCIDQLNLNRADEHRIESTNPDSFLTYLKTKITSSIEASLQNLIDPKRLKRIVVSKIEKDGGEIDFENEGVQSVFSAELFVETDETADVVRQSLEAVCLKDSSDEPEGVKNLKSRLAGDAAPDTPTETDEGSAVNCALRPYLYLMRGEMKITEVNLCDSNLARCTGPTNCEHVRDETHHKSSYRCRCNNGFQQRFAARQHNIEVHSCTDIDECADATLNDCDPETTTCENKLGSFDCHCNENYTRVNRAYCKEICSDNTCVHGTCVVFEKNFEDCLCHDGYKGENCKTVDGKMVSLRSLLALVSILLGLSILVVIVLTYIYVKKIECEDEQKLLKNERAIPMDDVSSYYQDRIDIRNMPRHSVQRDVIEEEELTDDEDITDF